MTEARLTDEQRVLMGATIAAALVDTEIAPADIVHVLLRTGLAILRQKLSCSETADYLREVADVMENSEDFSSTTVH